MVIEAPLTQLKIEEILKIIKNSAKNHQTSSLLNGHKGYNKIPDLSLEES
jgi:hypothetical protein